jgi:hypothetical protein
MRSVLSLIAAVSLAGWLGISAGGVASAHPACSEEVGIAVHGEHIVGDYVTGLGGIGPGGIEWPPAGQVGAAVQVNGGAAVPGGPGPGFHFTIDGLPPGASFCNAQAHPNGFDTPDHFAP